LPFSPAVDPEDNCEAEHGNDGHEGSGYGIDLMVAIVSDRAAQPVLNTGSLY